MKVTVKKKKKSKPKDIFFLGNIVIMIGSDMPVIITSLTSTWKGFFEGIVIAEEYMCEEPFDRKSFKQFVGTITLEVGS